MNVVHPEPGKPDFRALRRIAVFRALQLGDMLCVVPALRALRHAAPDAKITLVGLPWAHEFAERFSHYIDDFLPFPGFPGLPESTPDIGALPRFLFEAQQRHFELAIQMHGSGALSNPITATLGAARNAGFFSPGAYCPQPALFAPWLDAEHEVLRYLRLMQFLGIKTGDSALEFPLKQADFAALDMAGPLPAHGSYVCVHPGARMASRRWPAVRFALVADGLAENGWKVIVTGTAQERPVIDELLATARASVIDLGGRTTLGSLGALIKGARALVCNDTGVSHIAAATATPSVVVCCGADPGRWAPLDRERHTVLHADVACRPCAHEACPIGHPCARDVSASEVLGAALRLCAGEATAAPAISPP
jgi:ADP-heptose:LPS heptosyltransferase